MSTRPVLEGLVFSDKHHKVERIQALEQQVASLVTLTQELTRNNSVLAQDLTSFREEQAAHESHRKRLQEHTKQRMKAVMQELDRCFFRCDAADHEMGFLRVNYEKLDERVLDLEKR